MRDNRPKNKFACASILMNILLLITLSAVLIHYNQTDIENLFGRPGGGYYSYLDNQEYQAYTSMFELSKRKTAKAIFAGDSLTARANWNEFFQDTDIINRGVGSDTAEGLFNRITQVTELSPKSVFIMIGINDIAYGIDPEETIDYLSKTCRTILKECPDTDIYIESILPNENDEWKHQIETLNDRYKELCEKKGYTFIDLYDLYCEGNHYNPDYYCDGTHLNGQGYELWIQSVEEYIDN